MRRYIAYWLVIESEIALPEMEEAGDSTREADVVIRFGEAKSMPADAVSLGVAGWASRDSVLLRYEGSGVFLIRAGREIIIDRSVGASDAAIRTMLVGVALGVLLHQRGQFVLHASCVTRDGVAIAFAADSGTGKSTLAAAFVARGFNLIADDVVAIDTDASGGPKTVPGLLQMKLSEQSARSIGADWDTLADLGLEREKRGHRTRGAVAAASLPLRRIYLPADDTLERIQPLPAQGSFGEIIHHSYALSLLGPTQTQSIHLRQAARLATEVPICRLGRRRSLELLPDVVSMVERDLGLN